MTFKQKTTGLFCRTIVHNGGVICLIVVRYQIDESFLDFSDSLCLKLLPTVFVVD